MTTSKTAFVLTASLAALGFLYLLSNPSGTPAGRTLEGKAPRSGLLQADPPGGGTEPPPTALAPAQEPERRPLVSPSAGASCAWRARLSDWNRQPLEGAIVSLWNREGGETVLRQEESTDGQGLVRFTEAGSLVVVLAPGHGALVSAIDPHPTLVELSLPEPALTGTVQAPLGASLEGKLWLRGVYSEANDLGQPFDELLQRHGMTPGLFAIPVSAEGHFAVSGLASGRVLLHVEEPFRFDDDLQENELLVTLPSRLDLRLRSLPTVVGRTTCDSALLESSALLLQLCIEGGAAESVREMPVRANTGFGMALLERGDSRGILRVLRRRGSSPLVEKPIVCSESITDVGTLELRPITARLRIEDERGFPLAEARAFDEGFLSRPSDATGILEVLADSGIVVVAPARDPVVLERVIPESTPPFLVVLPRETTLEVSVQLSPDSSEILPLGVLLRMPRSWTPPGLEHHRFLDSLHAAGCTDMESDDSEVARMYTLPSSGRLVFRSLRTRWGDDEPGEAGVELRDRYGHMLEARSVSIVPGAASAVAFGALRQPRTVTGCVQDHLGQPISWAEAALGQDFTSPLAARVDERGYFRFGGVLTDHAWVSVHAEGFVDLRVPATFASGCQPYVMERARNLWLEVVELTGGRIDCRVVLRSGAATFGGIQEGPGCFRFYGIPAAALHAVVQIEGQPDNDVGLVPANTTRFVLTL